jgi:cytochrome c oxidase subunit 1
MPTSPSVAPLDRACTDGSLIAALRDWVGTDSPQRFALRHAALAAVFLACGIAAAVLMRLELLTPRLDLMEAHTFGALLSLHGSLLFYVAWLPAFPAVLGYVFVPRLVGAPRLAWPRLMLAAWVLLLLGGLAIVDGFVRGGTEAGWTFDAQFGGHFSAPGTMPMAVGVGAAGAALALIGANLLATILRARRGPVAARDLPAIVALLCAAATAVVAGVEITACTALVGLDHVVGLTLFDPDRGSLLLFKALCRLSLSAAQSLMLLMAFAVVLAIVGQRTGAALTARRARGLARAIALLALAGLGAWPATEASVPAGPFSGQLQCALYVVAAAATISLVLRAVALLWHRRVPLDAPLAFAFGFLLSLGVLVGSGAVLAVPATGHLLGSTTFATAHGHVLAAALGMALLAGLHEAWPLRAPAARTVAMLAAGVLFVGTYLTFVPMFVLGLAGASFRANSYPPGFQVPQVLATAGMTILLAGLGLAGLSLLGGRNANAGGRPPS